MINLNANAKAFVPDYFQHETEMFDRLEEEFVKNNQWIFNYDSFVDKEYAQEKRFNKVIKGDTVGKQSLKRKREE